MSASSGSCLITACVAVLAGAAHAQTAGDGGQSDSAVLSDAVQLTEVVVTAERRSESLQDTPISVLSFSGLDLEQRNVSNIADLQNFLPNVSIGGSVPNGAGAPDFSIRGVGQTSGRANSEKGIGLYIDDIYYPRSTGSLLALGDVQRIEVLRGPQGTLFGRNNTGGAIRYFTNLPGRDFEARGTVTVGSRERRDVDLLLNVPLGENAALRAQAAMFKRDGFVDVVGTGRDLGDQEDYVVRTTLRLTPTDDLDIKLRAAYTESSSNGDPVTIGNVSSTLPIVLAYNAYLATQGQPPITTDDPRWVSPSAYKTYSHCALDTAQRVAANFGPGVGQLSDALAAGSFCEEFRESKNFFLSADIDWHLRDGLTFRSLTGFNSGEDVDQGDYGLFGASTNSIRNDMKSFSQELQLTGDGDRMDWVVGLYFFREEPVEATINRQLVLGGPDLGRCCSGFDRIVELKTNSYAAFSQATFAVTDKLRMTGGLRYTYDEKSVVVTKTGIYVPTIPVAERVKGGSDNWDAVDWRATVDYHWTPDLMTYATVSRGFKSGGFNGDISIRPGPEYVVEPYDPETVTNYEVGLRSEWLARRLRVNLSAFHMELDDLVVQFADFTGGGLTLRFLNAGFVDLEGVEAELQFAATRNLTFNGSFGYTHLDYEYLDDNSPLFRAGVGTCPAAPATRTWTDCADSTQPLTRTPEITYAVGADWRRPLARGQLLASLSYAYKDEIWSGNSTSNAILLDDYGVANARITFISDSFWEVSLFGSNIFDKTYYTAGLDGRGPGNPVATLWRSPGPPAEWGLSLTARF